MNLSNTRSCPRTSLILRVIEAVTLLAGAVCPTIAAEGRLRRFDPPANAVVVEVGTDIQSVVDKHPPGTAFLIKAGIHRNQMILPKDGMSFYGAMSKDGRLLTTLSGADAFTSFKRSGPLWVIADAKLKGRRKVYEKRRNNPQLKWEGIHYRDDLYIDNLPLRHVGGAGLVLSWTWPGVDRKQPLGSLKDASVEAMIDPKVSQERKQNFFGLFTDEQGSRAGIVSEFFDFTTELSTIPDMAGRSPDIKRIDKDLNFPPNGYVWFGKDLDDRFVDTFASRHTGFLKIAKKGEYTFYLQSDDGSKLWIDGKLVIDNDGLKRFVEPEPLPDGCLRGQGHYAMTEKSHAMQLDVGFHAIRLEFFKNRATDRLTEEERTWYYDYGNGQVYFTDNPEGKTVEVSKTLYAFLGNAKGIKDEFPGKDSTYSSKSVIIRNLKTEKYTDHSIYPGPDWIVEGNEVCYNHSGGIYVLQNHKTGCVIRNNYIHHNGGGGIGIGSTDSVIIESNHISFNNFLHHEVAWSPAGIRNCFGDNCIIRGNVIHDNLAKGIWLDMGCKNTLIEGNTIFRNTCSGITVEISPYNTVRNNTVGDNSRVRIYDKSEIYVQSCGHNKLYGNVVQVSSDGKYGINVDLGDRRQTWDPDLNESYCHENVVTDNVITYLGEPGFSGVTAYFTGWDTNHFDKNTYHFLPGWVRERFRWQKAMSFEDFQKNGQERNGKVVHTVSPIEWTCDVGCK